MEEKRQDHFERLVEANMGLVVSIASQYRGQGLGMDDLICEGNIGLVKAASRYDASKGASFASYAVAAIRREIERGLQREKDERRAERAPGGHIRSVDAPLGAKPTISLLAVLADANSPLADQRVFSAAAEKQVERALECLNERESRVVSAYFGIGRDSLTMAERAEEMGLRRERVRQIRNRAIRRMRKAFRQDSQ